MKSFIKRARLVKGGFLESRATVRTLFEIHILLLCFPTSAGLASGRQLRSLNLAFFTTGICQFHCFLYKLAYSTLCPSISKSVLSVSVLEVKYQCCPEHLCNYDMISVLNFTYVSIRIQGFASSQYFNM